MKIKKSDWQKSEFYQLTGRVVEYPIRKDKVLTQMPEINAFYLSHPESIHKDMVVSKLSLPKIFADIKSQLFTKARSPAPKKALSVLDNHPHWEVELIYELGAQKWVISEAKLYKRNSNYGNSNNNTDSST